MQTAWLAAAFARDGYIVAAVNHHGNSAPASTFDPRGFVLWWERTSDLSVLIDRMLADPTFGQSIDTSRIVAAGISLGGFTMASLAGGRVDLDAFNFFCASPGRDATCVAPRDFSRAPELFSQILQTDAAARASLASAGASRLDARVKAVVPMAPGMVQAFTPASLREIRMPMLVIVGRADQMGSPRLNANFLAATVPGARLLTLQGANHFVFINPCTENGKRSTELCTDGAGTDRVELQRRIIGEMREFFRGVIGR
jgi:predicted dienelactone hydrolase